jgi:hypothetical protein
MTTTAIATRALLPRLADATNGVVVCIATGPSLTAEDVAFVKGKATVICVNDAWRLAPWADVVYSSDRYWMSRYRCANGCAGAKATIEFSPGRAAKELRAYAPDIRFYRNTGHHGVETQPDGLRTCGQNSGGAAVNLAVHLGATRIVLLGYDMGYRDGQRHFFGDHPPGLSNTHNFPTWRRAFQRMAPELAALGVDVVNATRASSLEAFPMVPLRDAL